MHQDLSVTQASMQVFHTPIYQELTTHLCCENWGNLCSQFNHKVQFCPGFSFPQKLPITLIGPPIHHSHLWQRLGAVMRKANCWTWNLSSCMCLSIPDKNVVLEAQGRAHEGQKFESWETFYHCIPIPGSITWSMPASEAHQSCQAKMPHDNPI